MSVPDEQLTTTDFCLITVLWGVAIVLVLTGLTYRLGVIL